MAIQDFLALLLLPLLAAATPAAPSDPSTTSPAAATRMYAKANATEAVVTAQVAMTIVAAPARRLRVARKLPHAGPALEARSPRHHPLAPL